MTNATIQTVLSELLAALGFTQMSIDVLKETDAAMLSRYAKCVVKNSPEATRQNIANKFRLLGLL